MHLPPPPATPITITMDAASSSSSSSSPPLDKKHSKMDKKKKEKKRSKRVRGDDDDDDIERRMMKKEKKRQKKENKKKKKKRKRESSVSSSASSSTSAEEPKEKVSIEATVAVAATPTAKVSADDDDSNSNKNINEGITLLLFYQYVEPPWDEAQYQTAKQFVSSIGQIYNITGRIRCAREGLNCTLTGSRHNMQLWIDDLRKFDGGRSTVDPLTGKKTVTEFANTEFKLTHNLPQGQRFPRLNVMEVIELVNYGLAGARAPPISKHGGQHLEPHDYHTKMTESDVVVIDVRNHYESNIGRFVPPPDGATVIDPKMRKSTEFPLWLDKPETKEMLRNKQVLMYCTGGVRCERASALLKQKMDTEEDTKSLGIKGVYQLQGGIDKYFKEFPMGGMWRGKNYVFDKRFAHAPPGIVGAVGDRKGDDDVDAYDDIGEEVNKKGPVDAADGILGKCEACSKPWDMYRGKRRCPTCGVPSLICRSCFEADKAGTKKLDKYIRCDLCVAEDVKSKREFREREEKESEEYENKLRQRQVLDGNDAKPLLGKDERVDTIADRSPCPNPEGITRLFLKNMCAKRMDESTLLDFLHPAKVTHIQWLTDRNTGKFYGSAFIETATLDDAGLVLAMDGCMVLGRKIKVKYQRADEKDLWPIPNTKVASREHKMM